MPKAFTWDTALWLVIALFFAPYMLYSFMGPKGELIVMFGLAQFPYRAAQMLFAIALLGCALVVSFKHRLVLSGMAKFILAALIGAYLAQMATLVLKPNPQFQIETLQLTLQFVIMLIGFDLAARRMSFEEFARTAAPLAFIMIVASVIHLQFFPIKEWGRALYFGLHPNFGGEMMMGAAMLCAFMRRPSLRWIAYALALYALVQVQSRASILAVLLVIFGTEIWGNRGAFTRMLAIGAAGMVGLSLVLLLSPNLMASVSDYVLNDIFFINNPNRGLGSGFVGRDETWAVAFKDMESAPFTGMGIQQSGTTLLGTPIHGGHLKLLAEFGMIIGGALNVALILGTILAFRVDRRLGFILLGCHVQYFFAARSVNLNIFPLIMWIGILPWKPPVSLTAPTSQRGVAPATPPPGGLAAATR